MRTFSVYETEWGVGAAIFSERGLAGIALPQQDDVQLIGEIDRRFGACKYNQNLDNTLSLTLERYFRGERVHFDIQVDYGLATKFEKEVYEHLRGIPYGETSSYRALAERCGRPGAARAVGNAMAKNPVPIIIPCHRVLRSDRSIGGWSGLPGWKERLLRIEGML
ncbi:MAG: methylated-DNA--[protein]-cysteine S-methyltransferase [Actinobacteria bacterium]|nr:methylated-DNA--[protein]-cysteine S-methyltransferase [Actinomycetota bacterium]